MIYSIRLLSSFETLFKKIARKAKRLGLLEPTFKVVGRRIEDAAIHEEVEAPDFSGMGGTCFRQIGVEKVEVHDIEITGLEPVRYNGWSFLAVVETTKDGNLLHMKGEQTAPERYHTSGCTCEHCGLKRNRVETFLVQHESGEVKQVGRQCLKDFVGNTSVANLAEIFKFYGEIFLTLRNMRESEIITWGRTGGLYSVVDTLTLSMAVQRLHGWTSKTKAKEQGGVATAEYVGMHLSKPEIEIIDADIEKANEAVDYFAACSPVPNESELHHNLRTLCANGYHSKRSLGLACAIWVCYQVEVNKKAREDRQEHLRETSQHLWTPGQRVKGIEATIVRVVNYETQWGFSSMTILEDARDNVIVAKGLGFEEGTKVRFTATVKEHGEYDGVKQTSVIRATKIEAVE